MFWTTKKEKGAMRRKCRYSETNHLFGKSLGKLPFCSSLRFSGVPWRGCCTVGPMLKEWFLRHTAWAIFTLFVMGEKKLSEGHPFLPVWLFFISLKSVNLEESATLWEWVGCSLIRAIRQEINTAVGPTAAGKVLTAGLTGSGNEILAVTWADTRKIY